MARTVLLADDSVTAQNMGRRILTDAGYDVITVNNGSAALKKIHESHPDLIVLDVYMPGYGGLEVCQRLKESGETMRIPVLLSVGKMEPFKADEAKRVRADAHIVKPFEASELLAALAKLEDRIVPQGDSVNGRKSKKPSFWHGGEESGAAQRDWTENAAYLAQVKQRKNSDAVEGAPDDAVHDEPVVAEEAPKAIVAAATQELPVIPDGASLAPATDEHNVQENTPTTFTGADSAAEAPAIEAAPPALRSDLESVDDRTAVSENHDPTPTGADENSPAQGTTEPSPTTEGANKTEAVSPSAGRWVAENVALSPEEAALELDQEMRLAEAPESVQGGNASIGALAKSAPEETRGATFAAAAGAGSSAVATTGGAGNDETEPPIPSEAAAAWENWQHIRETVMNGQTATAIVETVAQVAKANSSQETSPAPLPSESSSESSPSSEMEAGALASLVDSVLAELKPKLMEEIAKKLKK